METLTLYRPVGPAELALIERSGWREFPPRLPEQPVFYPVLNEEYATQAARDWNVRESGAGFVTGFQVDAAFAGRYPVQTVRSSGFPPRSWTNSRSGDLTNEKEEEDR